MVQDVVRELGYLTLGSRLKRIGERLQGQAQLVLGDSGISLPSSHFPVLAALDRLGSLSVGELAEAIGISQPAVTRMLDKLESEGLVKSNPSARDRRVRPVALTKAGAKLIFRAKESVWPKIEAAVAEACAGAAGPLLAQLTALEEALAAMPLNLRVPGVRP
ncbi:MAG TPA: MarR family transcriptional regulator [Steroidobacteraceae bacterium]|nr:MarR family transcriptional regulator [Steroidobacteraceae bacterium]